eukprot:m.251183 g.251183  ORF g.251183 m.251183 type:complete len:78 (-) comp90034_c0_seq1:186-419(-)
MHCLSPSNTYPRARASQKRSDFMKVSFIIISKLSKHRVVSEWGSSTSDVVELSLHVCCAHPVWCLFLLRFQHSSLTV